MYYKAFTKAFEIKKTSKLITCKLKKFRFFKKA